jgi:PPK2 family polyphosphate:nucleotide phosphotransferase
MACLAAPDRRSEGHCNVRAEPSGPVTMRASEGLVMIEERLLRRVRVAPGKKVRLKAHDTTWVQSRELKAIGKEKVKARAKEILDASLAKLSEQQDKLYADDRYSILVVLQALDAAGKDGTIRHVMSGVNPQGCEVYSFKQPSTEELDHTFLWRCMRRLPERGRIGIFNRSYYEDVLVVRVHPQLLEARRLPNEKIGKKFWQGRFDDINNLERHLVRNGTIVLKFFLNVSKDEQKRRFLERLTDPDKNWKFSPGDVAERACWDEYQDAYEEVFTHTSTEWAPWYIIPADHKWAARAMIADIISTTMESLNLRYPKVSAEQRAAMEAARRTLEQES